MNILFIGDVVGQKSCANLREKLPLLKKEYNIDTVIVNGENSADGNDFDHYRNVYQQNAAA